MILCFQKFLEKRMKKGYSYPSVSSVLSAILLSSASLWAQDMSAQKTNELDKVTVIGKTTSDYLSKDKPTITRSHMSLEETAKSIQVFNQEFIHDYQPQSINDIITMASNTTYLGDNHGRENMFAIRGFSNVPILRDGFNLSGAISYPEIFNLERIEVLKGPDSLQFGESSPGGLINLVKKRANLKEFQGQVELSLGSNTSYNPKLDLAGSLNEKGSLRYRLIGLYKEDDGIKDYDFNEHRFFIAPSIEYDINDNNTVSFMAEYLDETKHSDFGNFVKSNGELATDIETVTSHPNEKLDKEQTVLGIDFSSKYDTWSSLLKYRYIDYDIHTPNVHMPFGYNETNNTITKFFATQRNEYQEHALQYTFNKEFELFNLKHKLSTGADIRKAYSTFTGYLDLTQPYVLDLSSLSYESLTTLSDHPTATTYGGTQDKISTKKYGGFIQDNLYLTNNLILSAGLRYDKVNPENSNSSDAWVPQLGLVYHLNDKTTFYTNFSESFYPQTVTNSSGKLLDPEEGKGYELGIKQKLFNDNFKLTAALFKIEKENVAMTDPINPLSYVSSGKQTSRGIEVDLSGEIYTGWSLMASYGYTHTKDESSNNGNELAGIAKHTANIFTTYDLSSLGITNTYIGAGVRYIGSRYANENNTIKIGSNVIYNATAGYKEGNWQANISVQNLTDEEYIETARVARVSTGTPRTVIATLSYKF